MHSAFRCIRLLKQFRMFYKGEQPVGVALWALVDDLVAKRIDAGDKRLSAVEWQSGSHTRMIDVVAPFGGEAEMREQVRIT
jgi:cytolysin-activating lysine-acyltransferase